MIEIITPEVEVYNLGKLINKLEVNTSNEVTPAELLTEFIGRVCYNSYDKMGPNTYEDFNTGAANKSHRSIFEFNNQQFNLFSDKKTLNRIYNALVNNKFLKFNRINSETLIIYGSVRTFIEVLEQIVTGQINSVPVWLFTYIYKFVSEHPSIFNKWATYKELTEYKYVITSDNDYFEGAEWSFSDITTQTAIKNDPYKKILVRVVTDKGVHNELVRHRPMSFMAESQRYVRYGIGDNEKNPMKVCIAEQHYQDNVYRELIAESSERAFEDYKKLLGIGYSAQQARAALPVGTAMTYFMYGDLQEWSHIFSLRTAKTALPMAQEVIKEARDQMVNKHLI